MAQLTAPDFGGADLRFPTDLVDENKSFFSTFMFYEYKRDDVFNGARLVPAPALGASSIALPLPNKINNQQTMVWTEEEFQPLSKGINAAGQSLAGQSNILERALSVFAVQDIVSVTGGYLNGWVPNPFLVVLFRSPTFKRFSFDWVLAPTSQKESDELRKIVNGFRYAQLPDRSGDLGGTGIAAGLKYPWIVQVRLHPEDYLFKFKPCAIIDVNVDYSPRKPSFFKQTNAPTEVRLSIELMELEYWVKSDFEETH